MSELHKTILLTIILLILIATIFILQYSQFQVLTS